MDFSQTLENKEDKKTLFELGQNIHKYQGEILDKFFEELKEILPFENIDNKIDKKLMVSKNRCINWFLDKDKDFATFFKINDNYLFCVFLGKSNLHFGIVKHQSFKILNIEKNEIYLFVFLFVLNKSFFNSKILAVKLIKKNHT
jgi:hypothetical protein